MVAYSEHSYGEVIDAARTPAVSFRDVLFSLRRHRRLILAFVTLGSVVGTSVLLVIPPTYTAETSIVLDARKPRVVDLPSLVAERTTNPEAAQLRSEVDILQSDDLAERVIRRLALLQKSGFPTTALTAFDAGSGS
jgi:polysaccharide biosynthesis transport protein